MNIQGRLQEPYSNVILVDVVEAVDCLLREGSSTLVNSIVLGDRRTVGMSLVNLRGLGKEIWGKEDAQKYVGKLRDEWDK